ASWLVRKPAHRHRDEHGPSVLDASVDWLGLVFSHLHPHRKAPLVPARGFEPRFQGPKPRVLPLDEAGTSANPRRVGRALLRLCRYSTIRSQTFTGIG